jgi:signal peptidase II
LTEETAVQPEEAKAEALPPKPSAAAYAKPIILIVLVLVADQLLKYWVKTHMLPGEERPLIGHWGILHFTENNGIAFGLELPGIWGKLLLTTFRIFAAGLIFYILMRLVRRHFSQGLIYAGALVFAGATGNIIDSIFYGVWFKDINDYFGGFLQGRVVDMLYFPIIRTHLPDSIPFIGGDFEFFRPVFNLADSSITVGILLIILFYRNSLKKL